MPGALLATKVHIPAPGASLVDRPRLMARLDESLHPGCRLTLLSAPAGYGKTTLVCEWIRRGHLDTAWISLDEGDNDPARFLSYIVLAVRSIHPGFGQALLDMLQVPHLQSSDAPLNALLNEIAGIAPPFWVVLDDYHFIHEDAVHQSVAYLIDHLPPQAHLVIASRADPALPVAHLRGRGQMVELRLKDLRFTLEEAAEFLEKVAGLRLSTGDLAALNARAEGWVAGLQMAAASMQGQDDIPGFIQAFTGSNRFILDYLIEEVLQRQPLHIQTFLLHTSVLGRLGAPLCAAIMESEHLVEGEQVLSIAQHPLSECQAILERIERDNLFVLPLDDHREWYRYHRLFADLLQERLVRSSPELVPALHRRACLWFEEYGWIEEAIHHAIASGETHRAADLIEQVAQATLMRSEVLTFLRWVEALPEDEVVRRLDLSVYYAWALYLNGASMEIVESKLKKAAIHEDYAVKTAPLEALMAIYRGQMDRAHKLSHLAMDALPKGNLLLHSLAMFTEATSVYMAEGNNPFWAQRLEDIARRNQKDGNQMAAFLALYDLGDLRQKQGLLHLAEDAYRRALDLATDPQGRRIPVAGLALISLGDLARERNDLGHARHMIEDGISLVGSLSKVRAIDGYLTLALLEYASGDIKATDRAIQTARQLARQFEMTEVDDYVVELLDARLQLARGNIAAAQRWARQRGLEGADIPETQQDQEYIATRLRKYEYPTLARLRLAEGRYDDALWVLERALPLAEGADRASLIIEMEMVRGLVYHAKSQPALAFPAIERALRLAQPEGYMRVFLDEGPAMQALLQAFLPTLKDVNLIDYVEKLLVAFSPEAAEVEAIGLPEGLSARELEVLRLLPFDLSVTEIADKLVVSVHTVRSHVKSIYARLGVHSRYAAVARARESGLL
jgi:ATP/maltotriose-dependent transcriptional regulator MalT